MRHLHRAHRASGALALAVFGVLQVMGCSGAGAGCTSLAPIPTGRYAGPKNDNAVNLRLSPNGVTYLNNNWQTLVDAFAPGRRLDVPVACMKTNVPVLGDVYIADQGGNPNGCDGSCNDGKCDANDKPANVAITVTGFSLTPKAPDQIEATLGLTINTGKIYLTSPGTICDLLCSIDFNAATNPPNTNTVAATVKFSIDQKWDKVLSFDVTSIDGTQVCGASGAPAAPKCFDPADLTLARESGLCSYVCSAADWAPIKNFVLQQVSPMLQDKIKAAVAAQRCEACGTGLPTCPKSTDGTNTQAQCSAAGTCVDPGNANACVPRFLGVEGRLDLGSFLSSFGAPANAQADLSLAAGSSVTVDQGLSFGTRVGIQAVQAAPCVVPQAPPPMVAVAPPNFDAEAPAPHPTRGQYHAALGFSSPFMNVTMHEAHQAGALCLSLSTANVGLVNTGLFKTFLPSLGKLATRDGKDAPMMVVLRPAKSPTIVVGEGTYDPVTKKPIKPLILLTLPDLSIDFYAQLDDRYARLFTLTADITLPLSLIFEGCDKVTPAIGDLKQLVANIRTANSEMLAEDPKVLADLIPAVVGLAEPALAGALKPFQLPPVGQFKLQVAAVKGVGNITGSDAYNHLGIYAYLLPINATCAVSAPVLSASLLRSVMPRASDMRLHGQTLAWPEAVLAVSALNKPGSPEFSYRVDRGLWTDFVDAPGGELVVSHPAFLMQGVHQIEVRARTAEDPHGISAPSSVGFLVDWEAPELALSLDRAADRVVVSAHDVVTADGALQFAYAIGQGAFSEFGPARPISLAAVEEQGGVTVRVRDELGNVAEKAWRAPTVALRDEVPADLPGAKSMPGFGCSTVGGSSLLGLVALALMLRRR